jgi:hypothetical protein
MERLTQRFGSARRLVSSGRLHFCVIVSMH